MKSKKFELMHSWFIASCTGNQLIDTISVELSWHLIEKQCYCNQI